MGMTIRLRHFGAGLLALSLAVTPACTAGKESSARGMGNQRQAVGHTAAPQALSAQDGVKALGADAAVVQLSSLNDKQYVPIRELTNVLQFNTEWDAAAKALHIGDNDAPYMIAIDSKQANKDGDPITLADAPVRQGDSVYLPVSAVADLFKEEMSYEVQKDRLLIYPSNVKIVDQTATAEAGQDDAQPDFADDPKDPFKGPPSNEETGSEIPASLSQFFQDIPVGASAIAPYGTKAQTVAARNIDINALINKGKQYLGVRYHFSARPYPVSGRFDCSSFTQYLFGKYGISLPRTARAQARMGTYVSRQNLRKGDLLFFYVPGRFRTNRTVGHVGIYIGNGQMLNANSVPKNGVQIININRPYWKRVFLFAKRIAY